MLALTCAGICDHAYGSPIASSQTKKSSTGGKKQGGISKGNKKKTTNKGKTNNKGKNSKAGNKVKHSNKKESKAELQRRQQQTQAEIVATREKIRENERAVSKNLAELGKLEGQIQTSKGEIAATTRQVTALQSQIDGLNDEIKKGEGELQRMRAEYLKAVKQMRKKRKVNSDLAYLFSAKSLSEARQRMRYLRQFSEWRKAQTAKIGKEVAVLENQRSSLAQSKAMHSRALAKQQAARQNLEKQYASQDALVVELKQNGTVLRSHLQKKQQEVNSLKSRVAALIAAEEQARLEAERRQRAEAARREAERIEREREAEQRLIAEQKAQQDERDQANNENQQKQEEKKKNDVKKQQNKSDQKQERKQEKKQDKKVTAKPAGQSKDNGKSYAEARKRRSRRPNEGGASGGGNNATKGSSSTPANSGRFEANRGSLPRPVSGTFEITSRFGVHSLPDLPDVKYDNPGIDAEVAQGATALAVFAGKVSGVYMIPGFSTVVIVNHGEYYTVYGNLSSASVKVGDTVKQGAGVGTVANAEGNPSRGLIHFEVWKNRDKQNPESWIR